MPQVGDTVLHYELLSELGKGGMGQVYRALDTRLDREVALKFLLNQDQLQPEQKERLVIEAKAVAKLNHNHIGVLHSIEQAGDQLFLDMALYEGQSLEEKFTKGAISVSETLELAKQILSGLDHAHTRQVIHRDIKPANIFITTEGVVKILDFGVARLPDSNLTHQGQIIGSPNYMPPEQFKNDEVDERSDIWSFGVLLFQMLSGGLPFEGKFPQIMISILKEDPKPLAQHLNHPPLQSIIERCLAKDKQERFNSCHSLLAALNQLEMHNTTPTAQPAVKRPRSYQLTGREQELVELLSLVSSDDHYLITLAGIGGAGKTSVARAVLNEVPAEVFPDGVHFVALEALTDASLIPYEMAKVLNLQLQGQDLWVELARGMQDKTLLLCLDNLEQLIQDCAIELETLLNACPTLTILATSREVLNIAGEVIVDLKGLSVPPHVDADFAEYGASQLFITSAKRLKRSFDVEVNKEHILSICQQLEGWPLGIELAVAWIRQLSAEGIATQLQENLDFLTSRVRTRRSRHKSARAAFEYSWQLLNIEEQSALAKLSVFEGGFTSEAAYEVCQTGLPLLASLLDKSLLNLNDNRYDAHPLVLQYSREKFKSLPEHHVQAQHSSFFLDFVRETAPLTRTSQRVNVYHAIDAEMANIRKAWQWAIEGVNLEGIKQTTFALGYLYTNHGRDPEAYELFRKSAASLDEANPEHQLVLARLLIEQAKFHTYRREPWPLLVKAWSFLEPSDDDLGKAHALFRFGFATYPEVDDTGRDYILEALTYAKKADDDYLTRQLRTRALFRQLNHDDRAEHHLQQLEAELREADDYTVLGLYLWFYGDYLSKKGDFKRACDYFTQALQVGQQLQLKGLITGALTSLAESFFHLADLRQAEAYLQDAALAIEEHSGRHFIVRVYAFLGRINTAKGYFQEALSHIHQAAQMALEHKELDAWLVLVAWAEWLIAQGEVLRALTLLSFIIQSEAGAYVKTDANVLLKFVEKKLEIPFIEQAKSDATTVVLEEVLREIVLLDLQD